MSLLEEVIAERTLPRQCPVAGWLRQQSIVTSEEWDEALFSEAAQTSLIYRRLAQRNGGSLPFGERLLHKHRAMVLGKSAERCTCRS